MATNVGTLQLSDLAANLSAASGAPFLQTLVSIEQQIGQETVEFAKNYAPVRTGKLQQSITMAQSGTTVTITAGAPYSRYVEFGTGTRGEFPSGIIIIRPRHAKYLRFKGRDGKMVYTKEVRSPGMAPRPFLRPALERAADTLAPALLTSGALFIVKGPQAPETLTGAPATSRYK